MSRKNVAVALILITLILIPCLATAQEKLIRIGALYPMTGRSGLYGLGRVDQDDYYYIVARKTDLILVGGLNVYPREVELVLTAHPAVAEAAVVGVPDAIRVEAPKAIVILRNGERVAPQDLLQWCRQRLANYKVPRSIALVEDLPRTVTGKILKTAIRSAG